MSAAVTEHVARSARHVTFYLAAGPQDGPLRTWAGALGTRLDRYQSGSAVSTSIYQQ